MTSPAAPSRFSWSRQRRQILAGIDHVAVVDKVSADAVWSGRYAFMTLMSAGIAVLGLLLSSPAVVIGAMLISPLMGPIIGLGFALATFDSAEIRDAAVALAAGIVIAVLFCALIVLLSPIQNVTAEIASRTRPNLFDLIVALFSALAGAYAMVRGREGTIVGVAIATALMPPLAVVGFGLATANWTVFGGSLLLFFTNLMTITLTAAAVARFYGFGTHLSPQHTLLQTVLTFAVFLALAIPLGLSLRQIAWETASSARAGEVISAQFGEDARLSQIDIDYDREPLRVTATVLTPALRPDADRKIAARLTRLLGRKVEIELEQYRVGTAAQAEAQQVAAAQSGARTAEAERHIQQLADLLAVTAGIDAEAVTIDRDHKRMIARAAPLPGAKLAAYRLLELRLAANAKGWDMQLVPPAAALDPVPFDGDTPDAEGAAAIDAAAWGASRLGLAVAVSGAQAGKVADLLRAKGADARARGGRGAVTLEWLAPGAP